MKKVYLSLGSNIDSRKNVQAAIEALKNSYGDLEVSKLYESEPVGFNGDNFLNLVVAFNYSAEVASLVKELKTMEDELGRIRGAKKFSSRSIDIDIILFGDLCGEFSGITLPREEINQNAYVLLPLKEMAPNLLDPRSGLTMEALWKKNLEKMTKQILWEAEFQFSE
jgi:2-amino-4-hydroxy-6-hydroxymethyldihydropteridine diphosphokinase